MLWYSLEALGRGASIEYPQHVFLCRNKKKYQYFWAEKKKKKKKKITGISLLETAYLQLKQQIHYSENLVCAVSSCAVMQCGKDVYILQGSYIM